MLYCREKYVVTGGAGFVGSHLVDRLLADSRSAIVVFDNLSRGRLANLTSHAGDPRLQFAQGDVRDRRALAAAMHGARLVYHLAAQSTARGAAHDGHYTFTTNVVGTYNVLQAAAQCQVERVVFASSCGVYGEPIALPVDEDHPLFAINSYAASKAVGELYCSVLRRERGLQSVVLRLASIYGPRDFGRVIPTWLERANAGHELHVYGGKQIIDFVWIGQVVEALVRAASLDGPLPPINIASGTGTRIVDLARRISLLTGKQRQVRLLPARPGEVVRFVANVDRMEQIMSIEAPLDPLAQLSSLLASPDGPVSYDGSRVLDVTRGGHRANARVGK